MPVVVAAVAATAAGVEEKAAGEARAAEAGVGQLAQLVLAAVALGLRMHLCAHSIMIPCLL